MMTMVGCTADTDAGHWLSTAYHVMSCHVISYHAMCVRMSMPLVMAMNMIDDR
jgi:hypothetical protein